MPPIKHEAEEEAAMSRTTAYRKIIKPRLEKKRRDKQNALIDQLRDLIFVSPQDRDQATKMEKTRILEVAVQYVTQQRLAAAGGQRDLERFRAGYTFCATEVSRALASSGVAASASSRVMSHLGTVLHTAPHPPHPHPLSLSLPPPARLHAATSSPASASDGGYESGRDLTPSPPSASAADPVWRPF